jgi:uncharacterized protein
LRLPPKTSSTIHPEEVIVPKHLVLALFVLAACSKSSDTSRDAANVSASLTSVPTSSVASAPASEARAPLPAVMMPKCKTTDLTDCEAQCAIDAASCGAAGWLKHKAGDTAGGLPLLRKACDGGAGTYCLTLGQLYQTGSVKGIAKDLSTARDLFEKGCGGNVAKACSFAAVLYVTGEAGLSKDEAKMSTLENRACDLGFGPSCRGASRLVVKDLPARMALLEKGCAAVTPDPEACLDAGVVYEGGKGGITRDYKRAAELFGKACAAGHKQGCGWQKSAEAAANRPAGHGKPTAPDPTGATPGADPGEVCRAKSEFGTFYDFCDGECVVLTGNPSHCGRCNRECGSNEDCRDGAAGMDCTLRPLE